MLDDQLVQSDGTRMDWFRHCSTKRLTRFRSSCSPAGPATTFPQLLLLPTGTSCRILRPYGRSTWGGRSAGARMVESVGQRNSPYRGLRWSPFHSSIAQSSIDFLRHWIPMNGKFRAQGLQVDFDNFVHQLLRIPDLIENGFEQLALNLGIHAFRAIDTDRVPHEAEHPQIAQWPPDCLRDRESRRCFGSQGSSRPPG